MFYKAYFLTKYEKTKGSVMPYFTSIIAFSPNAQ